MVIVAPKETVFCLGKGVICCTRTWRNYIWADIACSSTVLGSEESNAKSID